MSEVRSDLQSPDPPNVQDVNVSVSIPNLPNPTQNISRRSSLDPVTDLSSLILPDALPPSLPGSQANSRSSSRHASVNAKGSINAGSGNSNNSGGAINNLFANLNLNSTAAPANNSNNQIPTTFNIKNIIQNEHVPSGPPPLLLSVPIGIQLCVSKLLDGGVLIHHRSKGGPKHRWVWCNQALDQLHWGDLLPVRKSKGFLPLNSIISISSSSTAVSQHFSISHLISVRTNDGVSHFEAINLSDWELWTNAFSLFMSLKQEPHKIGFINECLRSPFLSSFEDFCNAVFQSLENVGPTPSLSTEAPPSYESLSRTSSTSSTNSANNSYNNLIPPVGPVGPNNESSLASLNNMVNSLTERCNHLANEARMQSEDEKKVEAWTARKLNDMIKVLEGYEKQKATLQEKIRRRKLQKPATLPSQTLF